MSIREFRRSIKKLRRHVFFFLLKHLCRAFSTLPRLFLLVLVSVLSPFFYLWNRRDRLRMEQNLSLAFPEKSVRFRRKVAFRVFPNIGRGLVDFAVAYRRRHDDFVSALPMSVDWPFYLKRVLENGAVVITGHFGAWELLAAAASRYSQGRMGVLAKRLYWKPLNDWVEELRRAFGVRVFYQDHPPLSLVRFLRQGNFVGVLPDQDIRRVSGFFVPFFGRPAWTPAGPALLAKLAKVPIFVTFLLWEKGRWKLTMEGPIAEPEAGSLEEEVFLLTQKWTQILEENIRKYPDQWVWFHRRWRRRPEDARRLRVFGPIRNSASTPGLDLKL